MSSHCHFAWWCYFMQWRHDHDVTSRCNKPVLLIWAIQQYFGLWRLKAYYYCYNMLWSDVVAWRRSSYKRHFDNILLSTTQLSIELERSICIYNIAQLQDEIKIVRWCQVSYYIFIYELRYICDRCLWRHDVASWRHKHRSHMSWIDVTKQIHVYN